VTVYAIAQLRITNRAACDRYQTRFSDVFRRHRGRLLVAAESAQVVEGQWDDDEAGFRLWSGSPDYQEISKDRHQGADSVVLLVKGPA
jgi:uncharacterized protein (DUF1330 family)